VVLLSGEASRTINTENYNRENIMRQWAEIFRISIFHFTLLLLFVAHPYALASENSARRVFILHSYEANHVCGQPQHDGVIQALKRAGFRENENLSIETYFMDTKRKNNTPERMKEQAVEALKRIQSFHPDVLVVLDDNAFRTVAMNLENRTLPVVFCGMNAQPEDYNEIRNFMDSRSHPGHNITGVYEKLHIADALDVHFKLFPELKKVRFFVDLSPTGRAVMKQIKLEMKNVSSPCAWDIKVVTSWEDYQEAILRANADVEVGAIYPAALLLKNSEGRTYTVPDIFAWTVKHSTKPEISINFAFARLGLFGGAAVDFHAMGIQAGQMVVRALHGESPGDIPIEDAKKYALTFNLNRAKQLGIELPIDIIMAADEVISKKDQH